MAIRVYCDCGRKLSAPDDLAGRKTACPVCGAVIVVPKPGGAKKSRETVLTEEFVTGGQSDGPGEPVDVIDRQVTIGSHTAAPEGTKPKPKSKKRRRKRKNSWLASLMVPIDHLGLLLALSFLGALGATLFVSVLQADLTKAGGVSFIRSLGAFVVTTLLTSGVACEFFTYVAADASRADRDEARWVLLQMEDAVGSMVRCVLCFLCGPVFPIAFATWYWVRYGGVELIDRIILYEASAIAGGWFAFQILLTSHRPLAGMLPGPVFRAGWKLGWRSVVVAALMGGVIGTIMLMWRPAMVATNRDFHWAAFRLWFLIHVVGLVGIGVILDLLGGWYARFVEPLPAPKPTVPPPPTLPPMPIPEAIPESHTLR